MFLGIDYSIWWFLVFGAVITGYAVLDGFDLGAGALHLFLKKDESRLIALNAIGPVWDGNEVWLVIGGGVLFAGFHSKEESRWWRRGWDVVYCVSCITITLSMGLMLGNVALGMPLNEEKEFAGHWLSFFNPFSIMIAVTTLSLFMMHGAIYLVMKTENRLYVRLNFLAKNFTIFFVLSFGISSLYTLLYIPHLTENLRANPVYFVLPLIMLFAIANIPRQLKKRNFGYAFISSAITIASLLAVVAIAVFPNLLYATNDPLHTITVKNGASSSKTMKILLIIALIGTPLVATYTAIVFWTFKGKVKLDEMSYKI